VGDEGVEALPDERIGTLDRTRALVHVGTIETIDGVTAVGQQRNGGKPPLGTLSRNAGYFSLPSVFSKRVELSIHILNSIYASE
jgi:hypothetical protein